MLIERALLQWLYKLDHLYGLLLTFGLALIIEGTYAIFSAFRTAYPVPEQLSGATNLGFMILPNYRSWVVAASLMVALRRGS